MAQLQIYKVQAPDGQIIKVEGPAGASQDEVIQQAQRLYKPQMATQTSESATVTSEQPKQSTLSTALQYSGIPGLIEAAKGAGLSAVHTLQNIGARERENLKSTGFKPMVSDVRQPETGPEKAGALAEQVGEFFLPGGMVNKGVKAVEGAAAALKFPQWVQKALTIGTKAGLEAGSAGAVTAAQTGGNPEAVKSAAIGAAAIPIAGAVVAPVANALKSKFAQKIAPGMIDNLIRPPKRQLTFGKDPSMEIARRGITANSLEDLESKLNAERGKVGQQIDKALNTPMGKSAQVDIAPAIIGPIDEAIQQAKTTTGNQAVISRLEGMKQALLNERFKLPAGANPKSIRVSALDASKLKREIGDTIKWTDDATEGTVQDVTQKVYRNIRDAITAKVPQTGGLNRSYANLLAAEKSVQNRMDTIRRMNALGLSDIAGSLAGSMLGAVLTGDLRQGGLMGIATGAALRSTRSPMVATRLAAQFAKLSPGEKMAIAEKVVPLLRNIVLADASGHAQSGPNQ